MYVVLSYREDTCLYDEWHNVEFACDADFTIQSFVWLNDAADWVAARLYEQPRAKFLNLVVTDGRQLVNGEPLPAPCAGVDSVRLLVTPETGSSLDDMMDLFRRRVVSRLASLADEDQARRAAEAARRREEEERRAVEDERRREEWERREYERLRKKFEVTASPGGGE